MFNSNQLTQSMLFPSFYSLRLHACAPPTWSPTGPPPVAIPSCPSPSPELLLWPPPEDGGSCLGLLDRRIWSPGEESTWSQGGSCRLWLLSRCSCCFCCCGRLGCFCKSIFTQCFFKERRHWTVIACAILWGKIQDGFYSQNYLILVVVAPAVVQPETPPAQAPPPHSAVEGRLEGLLLLLLLLLLLSWPLSDVACEPGRRVAEGEQLQSGGKRQESFIELNRMQLWSCFPTSYPFPFDLDIL